MRTSDDLPEIPDVLVADIWQAKQQLERRNEMLQDRSTDPPLAYRVKMGREPIWLSTIEFRILSFLAARPYRAYSRRRIAEAVSTYRYPLPEDSLDTYIDSLRSKLGFFRDTIQSVPYIGYRFKA